MANKIRHFERNPGNVAFCYYRYSSEAQRDVSIDQQREAAHAFAKEHGYIIPKDGEFEDRAITGTTIERPGLQHMLYEAKHKRPAYLLVWKMDRLSREIHDSFFVDGQLRECGVQIVTLGEMLPEDEGLRFAIQGLYASMAHNFILNHRSNVMRGMNYNAENALYNGRRLLGYTGEKDKKYEIDPATAPIVQKVFRDYAAGKPLKKIADELNESGYRSIRGNKFTINSLASLLENRAYIGEYKWGSHTIAGGMPQLVSVELFEEAKKMRAKNRRGGIGAARKLVPADVDFWLSGHAYCGKCGAPLHGISGTSKSGKPYYYYTCLNRKKHLCSMSNQPKDKIETIARYFFERMLEDPALRMMIAKLCFDYYNQKNGDNGAYLDSLRNNLKVVEKKLDNFVKAISEGIFNESTQQAMRDLENQKALLKEQIASEELQEKCDIKLETIIKYFDGFVGNFDDEDVRRYVLDIFVDKLYLYEDSMIVTFHFIDDKQELSYDETLEMIKNHAYLVDSVNDPETHVESGSAAERMKNSLLEQGVDDSDFFP